MQPERHALRPRRRQRSVRSPKNGHRQHPRSEKTHSNKFNVHPANAAHIRRPQRTKQFQQGSAHTSRCHLRGLKGRGAHRKQYEQM